MMRLLTLLAVEKGMGVISGELSYLAHLHDLLILAAEAKWTVRIMTSPQFTPDLWGKKLPDDTSVSYALSYYLKKGGNADILMWHVGEKLGLPAPLSEICTISMEGRLRIFEVPDAPKNMDDEVNFFAIASDRNLDTPYSLINQTKPSKPHRAAAFFNFGQDFAPLSEMFDNLTGIIWRKCTRYGIQRKNVG